MPFLKGISTNRFDEKSFGFCSHLHRLLMNIVKYIIILARQMLQHMYLGIASQILLHTDLLCIRWGYLVFQVEYNVGIDVFPGIETFRPKRGSDETSWAKLQFTNQ